MGLKEVRQNRREGRRLSQQEVLVLVMDLRVSGLLPVVGPIKMVSTRDRENTIKTSD